MFVVLRGKKHAASMGVNKYYIIVRYDFSCYAWMYFVFNEFDVADAFETFLAD